MRVEPYLQQSKHYIVDFQFVGSFAKETHIPGADIDIMVVLSKRDCIVGDKTIEYGATLTHNGVEVKAQAILQFFLAVINQLFCGKIVYNNWKLEHNSRKTSPTVSTTITAKRGNSAHTINLDIIPTFQQQSAIFIPCRDYDTFMQTNSFFEQDFFYNDIPELSRKRFCKVVKIFKVCTSSTAIAENIGIAIFIILR